VPVPVWDIPVRLVHWLIVLLVASSWITAETGWLGCHRFSGYAILILVLFRIYWGFLGSATAQFAQFLRGPRTVARYMRTLSSRQVHPASIGHNPLGGWSVIALLSLLLLQATLGLFAVDVDGVESGPLATHVSFEAGRQIARLHERTFNLLLLLISLHITAVFAHLLYKRENLIVPMLTGRKRMSREQVQAPDVAATRRALIGLAIAILLVVALVVGV
jgi:cytochrome b